MVMVIEANYADGSGTVNALRMTPAEWKELQRTYQIGTMIMPCCPGAAVPKVSANGYPFFAHASGACSSSEESQWHQAAKIVVRTALEDLGCSASIEAPGKGAGGRWQADVWAERGEVRLAVEIQRSYQGLDQYRERQQRYRDAGVRALWLLRSDRYSTLLNSMMKERWRTEFAPNWPEGHGSAVADVPFAWMELEPEPRVGGASYFSATVSQLLDAVLTDRYVWIDGTWCIDNLEAMNAAMRVARERNQAAAAAASPAKGRRRRR